MGIDNRIIGLLTLTIGCAVASCDSADPTNRAVTGVTGRVQQGIMTAALDVRTSDGIEQANEPAAIGVNLDPDSRWVVAHNALDRPTAERIGWATSDDLSGTTWHQHYVASGLDFGVPADAPAAGGSFNGVRGDPGLAPDRDPARNENGHRLFLSAIGSSTTGPSDIVVAVSNDGGDTFHDAQFVSTSADGAGADAPRIASESAAPYRSWVTWTTGNTGWLNWFTYDKGFAFSRGTPVQIPAPSGEVVKFPDVAVGQMTACDPTQEAVFVIWATAGSQCTSTTTDNQTVATSLRVAVYLPDRDVWVGPFTMDEDPLYPRCIGRAPFVGRRSYNTIHWDVESDPVTERTFIAYTKSDQGGGGTRARLAIFTMACVNGTPEPSATYLTSPGPAGGEAIVGAT
jgi:hypothetical protein